MEETVSAVVAARRFSALLRRVREGCTYVVTHHGKPVAKIMPLGRQDRVRAGARASLLARLKAQRTIDIGPWTRAKLYEDGQ